MRQGNPIVKQAMEYDLTRFDESGDITLYHDGSMKGLKVGAIQIIITHIGKPSKIQMNENSHPEIKYPTFIVSNDHLIKKRPQVSVRAASFRNSSKDLSEALESLKLKTSNDKDIYHNKILNTCLTYDDINLVFKKFQGEIKGTIRYKDSLERLLSFPSFSNTFKVIMKLIGDIGIISFKKVICKVTYNNLIFIAIIGSFKVFECP